MAEIHIPYLPSAKFFKIRCRLGIHEQDIASDTDSDPQIRTIGGTVTITTSVKRFRYTEADGRARVVYNKTETYNIQTATGELFDADGNLGVHLLDTTSPGVDPQGWTYTATVRPEGGEPFDAVIPSGWTGEAFDLGDGLVFTPSTGITSLETRVKALEDASGGVTLPGGSSSTITADDTPAAPAEGESASYLVTSAVTWPAGLVWSTDPDGGVAPTITGSALVSLFTVGGVTRAIMGATFPGVVVPDTTAPAWSATLTTGASAATSVVVAASALATDAVGVTGYERSLDGGSTWAAVTPSGLNFTLSGLTAATSYPAPKLRAKDAAGNYSTPLTAQAFTTASGGDVTNPTPGTLASSAITSSGFTLTVTGASDAGGLHATPYAYSTDNGTTWSAWQAGATYNATGLTASTAYQARHKVRDAAGNEATGTAITVTTSAAATASLADAILALNPVGYWKLNETSGTQAIDYSGNARHGTYTGTYTLAGQDGFATFDVLTPGGVVIPDSDVFSLDTAPGLTMFAIVRRNTNKNFSIGYKGDNPAMEWSFEGNNNAQPVVVSREAAGNVMAKTTGPSGMPNTTWYAVAMSHPAPANRVQADVYFNKTTKETVAADTTSIGAVYTNGTGALKLAYTPPGATGHTGALGHVAVFAGQLTAAQIGSLISAAKSEGLVVA